LQEIPENGNWEIVASIGPDSDLGAIMLESLKPNVPYQVRAVIREKDNQSIEEGVLYEDFSTLPCTQLGNLYYALLTNGFGNKMFFPIDMTNTNVTVDSDFKLKVVHLVNDTNLCQIRGVEIKVGAKRILEQDEVRIDKELYQLTAPEEEMRYQITLFGDDGQNTTFNYIHKTDGKKVNNVVGIF
jgi:hypothetical protein